MSAAPLSEVELAGIAYESSQAERRAEDAERELMEWKKVKFMQDRLGDDFDAMILSVTKYGCFVELDSLFIEGLVPIMSLQGDHYTFRENTRQIIGEHSGRRYSMGDRVRVVLDRVDSVQRRLQFSILEEVAPVRLGRPGKAKAKVKPERQELIPTCRRRTRCCARASRGRKTSAQARSAARARPPHSDGHGFPPCRKQYRRRPWIDRQTKAHALSLQ